MKMIKELLEKFGHQSFLPLQEEAIKAIVDGQDLLLISPTGGGKSLVYQLPALRLEGVAVIVCPLLALMTQQVEKLKSIGIKAEFLNSTLNPGEQDDLSYSLRDHSIDLLFLSPEKLLQPSVIGLLEHTKVSFFAIDEAHCISQWGQGFRPEYGSLGLIREKFPSTPIVAMSGSADAKTQSEILRSLSLNSPKVLQQSYNRENIEITISQKRLANKQLLNFINQDALLGSGIVYCRSRRKVEELSAWLNGQGVSSLYFHANVADKDKEKNLKLFSEGDNIVMVATSAFGMGVDFDKVRFVAHMDLPNSVENYYQEIGRAGRDGRPARALLLYGLQDMLKLLQFEMEVNFSSESDWKRTLGFCKILEARGCRRQSLLTHFDETIPKCGNCDRCKNKEVEQNVTIAAQKFLSLLHKTKGVVSIGVLIQILMGKKTKAVFSCMGQDMSLFGKGEELNEISWKKLARYLIANEYILVQQFSPFQLALQEKSKAILKSEVQVVINDDYFYSNHEVLPMAEYKKKLIQWHANAGVDVFTVKQLDLVAQHKPKTLAAMSRLTGLAKHVLEPLSPPIYDVVKISVSN